MPFFLKIFKNWPTEGTKRQSFAVELPLKKLRDGIVLKFRRTGKRLAPFLVWFLKIQSENEFVIDEFAN